MNAGKFAPAQGLRGEQEGKHGLWREDRSEWQQGPWHGQPSRSWEESGTFLDGDEKATKRVMICLLL